MLLRRRLTLVVLVMIVKFQRRAATSNAPRAQSYFGDGAMGAYKYLNELWQKKQTDVCIAWTDNRFHLSHWTDTIPNQGSAG